MADFWLSERFEKVKVLDLISNLERKHRPSKLWVAGSIPAGITKLNTSKSLSNSKEIKFSLFDAFVRRNAAKHGKIKASLADSASYPQSVYRSKSKSVSHNFLRLNRPEL